MPTPSAPNLLGIEDPRRAVGVLVAGSLAVALLVTANNYALLTGSGRAFTWQYWVISLSRGPEWLVVGPALLYLVRRIQAARLAGVARVAAYAAMAVGLHSATEVGHTALGVSIGEDLPFAPFYWESWKNSALHHLWLYCLVGAAIYGYDRHIESARLLETQREREVREARLESELARAQLHALRMQVHPHFLFNALSAAAALTKRDPTRARRVLVDLGELLRLALDTTDDEIPLRDELAVLDRYFRIEKARMGDRLRVEVDAGPDVLDALVPPLLLQPLVENAVKHGLAPLEEGGAVDIRATQDGDALAITVADTGRGHAAERPATARGGIGLENVRRRLDRLYGGAGALSLGERSGGGTVAVVRLPFRSARAVARSAPSVLDPTLP